MSFVVLSHPGRPSGFHRLEIDKPWPTATQLRLGLACALADALHRALGWRWAAVGDGGTAAVVSPSLSHGLVPLAPIARLAKKGVRGNTIALLFNMIVAGNLPRAGKAGVVFVS